MKIFIAGSSGFLGKNFLDHEYRKNYQILAPNRKELNLFDLKSIDNFLKKNNPDLVINCAGRVGGIAANINNNLDFLIDNININKNLILTCFENKIKKFINFGSSCMYPSNLTNPLEESQLLNGRFEPTNEGFALSKAFSLKLCEYLTDANKGFYYKTIIPCNMFGKFDHFSNPLRSHMVASAIEKVFIAKKNREKKIFVWGTGKPKREYINANLVVEFVYKNLNLIEEFPNFFNLGVNEDYSVSEYYHMILDAFNFSAELVFDTSKPDGVFQKLMKTTLPNKLNFQIDFNIKKSISEVVDYYLKSHVISN